MANPMPFLPENELVGPIVRAAGEGKSVGVLGARSIFKVLSAETGGAYAILEQEIPAGHGPPLHVHRHETETFYILEGTFEFTVGDSKIPAPVGTLVAGPRDIPHTFRNVGTAPGKILLTVIPGRFSEYFIEVDDIPDRDLDTIKRLCAKYDCEILD